MSELPPNQLWAEIMAVPRPHRLVDFPRQNPVTKQSFGEFAIIVLTQEEQMAASASAERFTRQLLKESPKQDDAKRGYDIIYENSATTEVLFRACKRKEDLVSPFFPSPEAIRRNLSGDEVSILMNHYLTAQAEMGPIVSRLDPEEVEAWIKKLGEGGSAFPLDFLSLDALKNLAFSLACLLHKSSTSKSSLGSQLDEPQPSADSADTSEA